MSQEDEIKMQVHLEAQIEVLERRLATMGTSGSALRMTVERKQLLQRELELSKLRQSLNANAKAQQMDEPGQREAFFRTILKEKGLSVHDWAVKANVDFHTADKYLKGKRKPYPGTLKKLADALDVDVTKLPR
jgi:lambda repressor-like predicted transcriptional regulator